MFTLVDAFRDNETALKVTRYIEELVGDKKYRMVHVCGTHQDTLTMYGIRSMFHKNV